MSRERESAMGLRVIGTVLGVTSETVKSPTGAFADFVSTTIHVLDGMETTAVQCGKNFDRGMLPQIHEGDQIDLSVSLYKGRVYAEAVAGHKAAQKS